MTLIPVPLSDELSDFDLRDYCVPVFKETRGFMYILYDDAFPQYIKVGRTYDCRKRLQGYNSDKPFPTARMLFISRLFVDVNEVERRILKYMYDNTSPTTLSREWFKIEHKEKIKNIIERAEKELT